MTKATLLKKGIDVVLGIAEEFFGNGDTKQVKGDTVATIVGAYNSGRQLLMDRYENNLREVSTLIKAFAEELTDRKSSLITPLPVSTDIDSPDFSYGAFFHPTQPVPEFSGDVERAHREHRAKNKTGGFADPTGPVSRALDGQ